MIDFRESLENNSQSMFYVTFTVKRAAATWQGCDLHDPSSHCSFWPRQPSAARKLDTNNNNDIHYINDNNKKLNLLSGLPL